MELNTLYTLVLSIVLVGLLLGIGVIVLDKFSQSTGMTTASELALNNSRDAIAPIAGTWIPLIITVAVLAIILTLVITSFGEQR